MLGTPAAALAALKGGSIVATNLGSPDPANAVQDGYAVYTLRLTKGDVPEISKVVTQVIATTEPYYKAHPDAVKGFAAAYKKAATDMYADPSGAAKLAYQKYFSDQPEASFTSSFQELIDAKNFTTDPAISPSDVDAIGQFYQVTSTTPIPPTWKDLFRTP